MEGIIGCLVLSDISIIFMYFNHSRRSISIPCTFFIKDRHLLYHMVPVDFDASQAIDEKKEIQQKHIDLWQRIEKFLTH